MTARFEELRIEKDKRQGDIANILKVKRNTYSKWENEINDMPVEQANVLANYYKVTFDYMLGLTRNKNTPDRDLLVDWALFSERLAKLRKDINLVCNQVIFPGDKVEIEKLNMLNCLKYLQISYSNIIDKTELNINTLEELYIDNTNINSFSFLNNLLHLKRISIDEKQYINNKYLFDNLIKRNILVLNENMIEFGGENNEK